VKCIFKIEFMEKIRPLNGLGGWSLVLLLLSSCAQERNLQRSILPELELTNELTTAIEQLDAETKIVCAREEYKPLFLHTACKVDNITLGQLADKSKLATIDKPLFWKLHAERHVIATKMTVALRSYGGAQGAEIAVAGEQADRLIEKNALSLYDGTTNWGEYNERRMEIDAMFLDEVNRIDPPPSDSPTQITLPA